jgi:hypothetical protein
MAWGSLMDAHPAVVALLALAALVGILLGNEAERRWWQTPTERLAALRWWSRLWAGVSLVVLFIYLVRSR